MNIRSAMLCLDCDTVFDNLEYKQCPSCTSSQSVALTNWVKPNPLEGINGKKKENGNSGGVVIQRYFGRETLAPVLLRMRKESQIYRKVFVHWKRFISAYRLCSGQSELDGK